MPGTTSKIQIPQEMLEFYGKLKKIQDKYGAGCHFRFNECKEADRSRIEDYREPLIQLYQPSFDSDRLYEAFMEISLLVSTNRSEAKNNVDRIAALPQAVLRGVLEAAVTGNPDHFPDKTGNPDLNTYILKFIVANTVKPFLRAFAQTVSEENRTGSWSESFCPVCGNRPYIGRLAKEDGKRYLRCSLCDTEWGYKRLACCNCGNEDHNTLSFLMIEETPGYQIDVCEVCKSYLKIIDDRTGFSRDQDLSDVQTIYLDLIARQKGYSNDITNA